MENRKDLINLEKMIDFFTIKNNYEYVNTLEKAKYAMFPDVLQKELEEFDSLAAEEEIDRIIEALQKEVDCIEEEDCERFKLPLSSKKTIAISLGQAGLHYINMAQEKGWWDCDFLAIDSDINTLKKSRTTNTFMIGGENIVGPFKGDQKKGQIAFSISKMDLMSRLIGYESANAIIIANAAGSTVGAIEDLISLCQEAGINIEDITVGLFFPFSFESKQRWSQANAIKELLEEKNIRMVVVENSEVLKYCDRRTNIACALDVLDQIMAERLSKDGVIRKEERMGLR